MISKVVLVANLIFAWQLSAVLCDDAKSSLVFVIDDTGSMMDDIDEVKTQVDKLFDAAFNSNSSTTDEFVIVTFNDPDVKHRTTTKDRDVFKKALNEIQVDGGGDCPEMALTGLELALQHSQKNSMVYLFTDAGAKDPEKFEAVKAQALEKKCRLFFMLTGTCYGDGKDRVYNDLAEVSGGQIFSLFKKEVGQMLEYARVSIAGGYAASVPAPSLFRSKGDHVATFEIDDKTKEALISVSADHPYVNLKGPDGEDVKTEEVVSTSGSKVLKLLDAKPGTYTLRVSSSGPSSILVNKKPIS